MKTKIIIFTLILMGVICICCNNIETAVDLNAENEKVQSSMKNVFKALSERDWEALKKYTTTDMILLENGLVWNTDSLIDAMGKYWEGFDLEYSLDFKETGIEGSMAWVFYHNRCTAIKDTTQIKFHWLESGILKKDGENWKLHFAHSTIVFQPELTKRDKK